MAIDSKEKRAAILGVGRPWMRDKFPVATPDEQWRIASGNAYGGNALSPTDVEPVSPPVILKTFENRYLTRRILNTLYMLKRQFGGTINIYQMGDAVVDHLTGVKTIPKTITVVKRAIILPVKVAREVVQTISVISANKAFVVGGNFDTNSRMFIVQKNDAPNIELTPSDWILYRNKRYEVKSFEEYEFDASWVIMGKAIKGEIPSQIYPRCADNLIRLVQSSEQTP